MWIIACVINRKFDDARTWIIELQKHANGSTHDALLQEVTKIQFCDSALNAIRSAIVAASTQDVDKLISVFRGKVADMMATMSVDKCDATVWKHFSQYVNAELNNHDDTNSQLNSDVTMWKASIFKSDEILQLKKLCDAGSLFVSGVNISDTVLKFKYTFVVLSAIKDALINNTTRLENMLKRFSDKEENLYSIIFGLSWWYAFRCTFSCDTFDPFVLLASEGIKPTPAIFKDFYSSFKNFSDISLPLAKWIGIDQSCGIQNDIGKNEILDYIDGWTWRDKTESEQRRPFRKDLMQKILSQLFSRDATSTASNVTLKQFSSYLYSNFDTMLTGGALKWPTRSSKNKNIIKNIKQNKNILKKHGFLIKNKKGLVALVNQSDFAELVCDDTLVHDIQVASAADYSKPRFIASADVISYVRQKYILDRLRYKQPNSMITLELPCGVKIKSSLTAFGTNELLIRNMRDCSKYKWLCPMDYDKFDWNPTKSEVFGAISCLGELADCSNETDLLLKGMSEAHVNFDSFSRPYNGGIMSGWYLTNALDSIINLYWFCYAIELLCGRDLRLVKALKGAHISVMGDDVDLRCNASADEYKRFMSFLNEEMNLALNPSKVSIRLLRTEYLRTCSARPQQYLARAIHSIIQRNEKNATDSFMSLQGTQSAMNELLNRYDILLQRFASTYCIGLCLNEVIYYVRMHNLSGTLSSWLTYVTLPKIHGGLGCYFLKEIPYVNETILKDIKLQDSVRVIVVTPFADKLDELSYLFACPKDYLIRLSAVGAIKIDGRYPLIFREKDHVITRKAKNIAASGLSSHTRSRLARVAKDLLNILNLSFLQPRQQMGLKNENLNFSNIVGKVARLRTTGWTDAALTEWLKREGLPRRTIRVILSYMRGERDDTISIGKCGFLGNMCSAAIANFVMDGSNLSREVQ